METVKSLLADGTVVTVRQLGPADRGQVVALHQAMPDQDRHLRFFSMSAQPIDGAARAGTVDRGHQ